MDFLLRWSKIRVGMDHPRNITRYTYSDSSFQGWRLSMCRHHAVWHAYFSDREYGGEEKAKAAAERVRARALELLEEYDDRPEEAFRICKAEMDSGGYPGGLRPRKK